MTYARFSNPHGFSASRLADELAEDWRNGNRSYAIQKLDLLPKKRALAVVVYLYDRLEGDPYQTGLLRRTLSDRV